MGAAFRQDPALHDCGHPTDRCRFADPGDRLMALSFSGKLKDVTGAEADRTRMQELWNAEDPILKTTGIVNRHIDEIAGTLRRQVGAYFRRLHRGTRG